MAGLSMASVLAPVHAGSITYFTPAGSSTGGGPVDAEAIFTTTNGSISITLVNLQPNPTDVAQCLSDLIFTTSGTTTLNSATLFSSSGQEITVNSKSPGGFTLGGVVSTGWGVASQTGNSMKLDALGFVGPEHLIIGPPDASNAYSNGNGSIVGNKPHNPFLNQSATFTIAGSNITSSTAITSATFSFGTTDGINVVGQAVPEPSSVVLCTIGLGFVGAVGAYRSRRRQ
jgi:hypothetical protein